MNSIRLATMVALISLVLRAGASAAGFVTFTPVADASVLDSQGAAYCAQTGGVAQRRVPEFDTNNPTRLRLHGQLYFCQYTAKNGGSQISVRTDTLLSTTPTLAALAYYAKVSPGSCEGNPASCYCSLLGGTDQFGGTNLSGGGWVLDSNPNDVLETCIFPDLSSIDSFGLFYHSAGIIRGQDLAKVLRYKGP